MKKIIFPIIFILLITSVLALQPMGGILFGEKISQKIDAGLNSNYYGDGQSFGNYIDTGVVHEPLTSREAFEESTCSSISTGRDFLMSYTELNNKGSIITELGGNCRTGDWIRAKICYDSDDNIRSCDELFRDRYKKESRNDNLDLEVECDGNCFDQSWFRNAIDDKYVGWQCVKCTSTSDITCDDPDGDSADPSIIKTTTRVLQGKTTLDSQTDSCKSDGKTLIEYKCSRSSTRDGEVDSSQKTCQYGCSNGICKDGPTIDNRCGVPLGTVKCADDKELMCWNYGTSYDWIVQETCGPTKSCSSNQCVPDSSSQACVPNSHTCIDQSRFKVCSSDGSRYAETVTCANDEICLSGDCVDKPTTPPPPTPSSVPFCDPSMLVGVPNTCIVPQGQNYLVTSIIVTKTDGTGVPVINRIYQLTEGTNYKVKVTLKNDGIGGGSAYEQFVEVGFYNDAAQWLNERSREGFVVENVQSCDPDQNTVAKRIQLESGKTQEFEFLLPIKDATSNVENGKIGVVAYHRCWTRENNEVSNPKDGSGATSSVFIAAVVKEDPTRTQPTEEQMCSNNIADGQETDYNCGGPVCKACVIGSECLLDRDCQSSLICSKGTEDAGLCRSPFTTGFFGPEYCINGQRDVYKSKITDVQGTTTNAIFKECGSGKTCSGSVGNVQCISGDPDEVTDGGDGDVTINDPKVCCSGFAGRYSCVESTECEEGLFSRVVLEGELDYKSCPTECKVTDGTTGGGSTTTEDGQVTGKQKSMLLSDWQDVTAASRLQTICATPDQCGEYTDEDGNKLTVQCLGTTKITNQLDQDAVSFCEQAGHEGSTFTGVIAGGAIGCTAGVVIAAASVASAVASGFVLAPFAAVIVPGAVASCVIGGSLAGSVTAIAQNAVQISCERGQYDGITGACIAQQKGGDFFGPIVEAINNALGTDFGVGTVVIVLGVLILLLFIFLSRPQQPRMV